MKQLPQHLSRKCKVRNHIFLSIVILHLLLPIYLNAQSNIYGGQPVDISEAPYQVSLENQFGSHFCGGSIINCEWVVTAAHCVSSNPSGVVVHAGATDQTNNNLGQRIAVDQIIVHPNYITLHNDVALLHLATPLEFNDNVQPITYATPQNTALADIAPGTTAFITGWGDSGSGCCSGVLLGASLPVIGNQDAGTLMTSSGNNCPPWWSPPLDNSMIAFYQQGIAAGPGDSGGPAVITKTDGTRVLVGASSWGGCPRDFFPTMYANIRELSSFIDANVPPPSACCAPWQDIYISQNTTFNTPMEFNGNVFIQTGAQLTITSTVQFAKNMGIIVERGAKLHVNGGTLTRCPNAEDWRGINVEGVSNMPQPNAFAMPASGQAGVVLINNNAHVEWARTAISTTRFNEGWNGPYWGGMIHCENATFTSNRRVAEFMKYDLPNQSRFINCTIDGNGIGYAGVTIWDTDNVTFNRCRFYNMSAQGILVYDAGAIVKDGNDFQHNWRGISSRATYPYNAFLEVGDLTSDPNYFLDNWFHIESNASNYGPGLSVINNEFFQSNTAIWLIGPSRYTIAYNSIDQTNAGIFSFQTGALGWNQHNYIRNNAISAGSGIIAQGLNREMQFLCNNFVATWDFTLRQVYNGGPQGEVRQHQGSFSNAAGNCFTNPVQIADILTDNQTLHFRYYRTSDALCKIPVTPGNYTPQQAFGGNCSGEINSPQNPTYVDYVNIKNQINAILSNGGQPEEQLYYLLEVKDYMLHRLIATYIGSNAIESAYFLLNQENTVMAQLMKFGLQMDRNDYSSAKITLNTMPVISTEMSNFKNIQLINIDRLEKGNEFRLLPSDSLFLESVAISDMGTKGYARAILGLLFGREFQDGLEGGGTDGIAQDIQMEQASLTLKEKSGVRVYPNPAKEYFTVEMENLPAESLRITTVVGQIIHKVSLPAGENRFTISTQHWNSGMYLLQWLDQNDKIIHAERLVVNK